MLSFQSLDQIIHRKKRLFGNVHSELKRWYDKRKNKRKVYSAKQHNRSLNTSESAESPVRTKPQSRINSLSSSSVKPPRALPPSPRSGRTCGSHIDRENTAVMGEHKTVTEDHEPTDYEVCDNEHMHAPAVPPRINTRPIKLSYENTIVSLNVDEQFASEEDTEESSYLTPCVDQKIVEEAGAYDDLGIQDMQAILVNGQNSEDFYKMSVMQVSHLFRYCLLQDIGDVCYQQRLDGRFFRDFDLQLLKEEPFNATQFQIVKIIQIIKNGWRPKVD